MTLVLMLMLMLGIRELLGGTGAVPSIFIGKTWRDGRCPVPNI
jgi:hypothetical protein